MKGQFKDVIITHLITIRFLLLSDPMMHMTPVDLHGLLGSDKELQVEPDGECGGANYRVLLRPLT